MSLYLYLKRLFTLYLSSISQYITSLKQSFSVECRLKSSRNGREVRIGLTYIMVLPGSKLTQRFIYVTPLRSPIGDTQYIVFSSYLKLQNSTMLQTLTDKGNILVVEALLSILPWFSSSTYRSLYTVSETSFSPMTLYLQ